MKLKSKWVCTECGSSQTKWSGSCYHCGQWDTLIEEREELAPLQEFQKSPQLKPLPINQIDLKGPRRFPSGIADIDRLLGGGVVEGSLILLGGNPGIGKSTLLLQLAHSFTREGKKVLYICAEESVEQTSMRAKRLDLMSDQLFLFSVHAWHQILEGVKSLEPAILIIDSVQVIYKEELNSSPGTVAQVKEITMAAMHLAKKANITTFLVGHVTKSGDLAGPRVLEHMVDTVLEFEGDRHLGLRLLRSIKNRFGPTDEMAVFQMGGDGLKEVPSPSLLFLHSNDRMEAGSCIAATLEGTRAMLVELQALVSSTSYPSPARRVTGIDSKRLPLLIAVLERRMGLKLQNQDIYVSAVGGARLHYPDVDLAIVLSIASSYFDHPLPEKMLAIGEIGLSGEVRGVSRVEARLKEAKNLGYNTVIVGKNTLGTVNKKLKESMNLIAVDHVVAAFSAVFKK